MRWPCDPVARVAREARSPGCTQAALGLAQGHKVDWRPRLPLRATRGSPTSGGSSAANWRICILSGLAVLGPDEPRRRREHLYAVIQETTAVEPQGFSDRARTFRHLCAFGDATRVGYCRHRAQGFQLVVDAKRVLRLTREENILALRVPVRPANEDKPARVRYRAEPDARLQTAKEFFYLAVVIDAFSGSFVGTRSPAIPKRASRSRRRHWARRGARRPQPCAHESRRGPPPDCRVHRRRLQRQPPHWRSETNPRSSSKPHSGGATPIRETMTKPCH